jgi:hypothetical protein
VKRAPEIVVSFLPPNTRCVAGAPFPGSYSPILTLDATSLGLAPPFLSNRRILSLPGEVIPLGLDLDRHVLYAVDEVRPEKVNLAVERDLREARSVSPIMEPELEAGEARPEAEVLAVAEREVFVRVPCNVEASGSGNTSSSRLADG